MKKVNLPWLLPIALLIGGIFLFFQTAKNAQSAPAGHIVISEVQTAGVVVGNDFLELYNPTSSDISLEGFRLVKRTSTGTVDTGLIVFTEDDVIPSHGYYLWCNSSLFVSLGCDRSSSGTLANDNSFGLRNGALNTGALIDAITIGTVTNALGEGTSLPALPASGSAERKANSVSTAVSMQIGGIDEFIGNAEDTDDNSADFVIRAISQPQNSFSALEPVVVPTPTNEPTPTLEPTAVPTEVPTPTIEPTEVPTPTTEPTVIPTVTVAPTVVPTIIPTVSPTPSPFPFSRFFSVTCTTQIKTLNFGFFQVHVSIPFCRLTRV